MEFVGLSVMSDTPYATTVTFLRGHLRELKVIDELFEILERHLGDQGLEAHGREIIDDALINAPKQGNRRQENK